MGEQGCVRAWAYRYIAGIRDPEPDWATYARGLPTRCGHDPRLRDARNGQCRKCRKLRSQALGKALHAIGEATYRGEPLPAQASGLPLAVWASGATLLPHPDECVEIEVEAEIGDETIESEHFTRAMRVGPILIAGLRDLTVRAAADVTTCEALNYTEGWLLLVDYKTTSNIPAYAKRPDELVEDLQCNVYALDLMRETGERTQACRWVYFETKDMRRALPVDVAIELARAEDIVGAAADFAHRELDPIERVEDALCNTMACGAYGGCMLHESVGGPCTARRRAGAMIQSLIRVQKAPAIEGKKRMAIDKSKYAHLAANAPAVSETAPAAAAPAAAAPAAASAPAPAQPAASTTKRRGRPPAAQTTPAATTTAPESVDVLGAIKALVSERDAAVARVQSLDQKLGEARAALAEALGETAEPEATQ